MEVVTLQVVKRKTKNGSGLVEKLSNLYQRMSTSGSLNPEKIVIDEETYETGAGSSKNENAASCKCTHTWKVTVQGIENYLCFVDFNPEVVNYFDGITNRSRKQTESGLVYNLKTFFEKRITLHSGLQRKFENIKALIQSRLKVRTVNEDLNE